MERLISAGILDTDMYFQAYLAVSLLVNEIDDCSDDTPAVGKVDVHLESEVTGFNPLRAENDVSVVVFRCRSGNVTGERRAQANKLQSAR